MDSIYGLVSVWVKSRNGCGNNYESKGFVGVLKKLVNVVFDNFGRELKKKNIIAYAYRGLYYLSMDTKNSFFGLHTNF